MRLSELFNTENILLDVEPRSKNELLEYILDDLNAKGMIRDHDRSLRDVIEREKVMSTGIGNGVAIPHAYTDGVDGLVACFYRSKGDVDFEALDGEGVDLFFIILGPKASRRDHIKVLAKISRILNHEDFRENLRRAENVKSVLDIFKRFGDR
ncbi:MAG: PTS sugar transporter subunit IIA [Candidatus Krumholzibacteria bacterium]|nr:PTS sugar transporter subunit IIA [Candidatus Krumholzibacteria bacterium]